LTFARVPGLPVAAAGSHNHVNEDGYAGSNPNRATGTGLLTQRPLHLHIGTGKAGSTTIQHLLGTQRQTGFGHTQVEAFGLGNAWKLAAASGTAFARRYWVEERRTLSAAEFDALGPAVWEAAARELAEAPAGPFVVSSEYIFAQYGAERDDIARLKADLDRFFGPIRIVVYLRDQVSYLKSFYAQRIKGPLRATESFETFIGRIDAFRHLWDYAAALEAWAAVFGPRALTVSVFDPANFRDRDLLTDFLHRIGVEDAQAARAGGTEGVLRANRSPSYAQLRLLRRLNALPRPLADGPLRTLVLNRRMRGAGSGFPDRFDRDILARVSDGNAAVNAAHLVGQRAQLPVLAPATAAVA